MCCEGLEDLEDQAKDDAPFRINVYVYKQNWYWDALIKFKDCSSECTLYFQ